MKVIKILFLGILQASLLGNSPWITVWVHGTKLFGEKINPYFFYSKPGMHPAKSFESKYRASAIATILSSAAPDLFPLDNFYFFGWDGKLSFESRQKAGKKLYKALKKIKTEYCATYNIEPKIRVITHSHGGNVALNASLFYQEQDSLIINELILLACPVQAKTKAYIEHPLFEKVYSLFCPLDLIQVLDPQKLHYLYLMGDPLGNQSSFFSEQLFDHHAKLTQIKIIFNTQQTTLNMIRYLGLAHLEFLLDPFITQLPKLLQAERNNQLARSKSVPGIIKAVI